MVAANQTKESKVNINDFMRFETRDEMFPYHNDLNVTQTDIMLQ